MISKIEIANAPCLLNIGCGMRFHADWINIDSFPASKLIHRHDITKGLPFDDQTFDAVYHSHVLEHMDRRQASALINECYRILKSRGVLRVVVPNLERITELYLMYLQQCREGYTDAKLKADWMRIELLDQLCRQKSGGEYPQFISANRESLDFPRSRCGGWVDYVKEFTPRRERLLKLAEMLPLVGRYIKALRIGLFRIRGEVHLWMYDELSLKELCANCGFKDGVLTSAYDSKIPGWSSYFLDYESNGMIYKPDSMFMEFVKD